MIGLLEHGKKNNYYDLWLILSLFKSRLFNISYTYIITNWLSMQIKNSKYFHFILPCSLIPADIPGRQVGWQPSTHESQHWSRSGCWQVIGQAGPQLLYLHWHNSSPVPGILGFSSSQLMATRSKRNLIKWQIHLGFWKKKQPIVSLL